MARNLSPLLAPHMERIAHPTTQRGSDTLATPAEIARVFISHSSRNKTLADAVAADLEESGIRCWLAPRDIRPGEPNYGKAIIEGLSSCQAMVLLLTEHSNRSQHVMKEA